MGSLSILDFSAEEVAAAYANGLHGFSLEEAADLYESAFGVSESTTHLRTLYRQLPVQAEPARGTATVRHQNTAEPVSESNPCAQVDPSTTIPSCGFWLRCKTWIRTHIRGRRPPGDAMLKSNYSGASSLRAHDHRGMCRVFFRSCRRQEAT
jgi:hypothetical protein